MRSGWDKDATYMLFDAGPFGYGHQHEDKLHFVLWSNGRQLVLDPGSFSYDHSRWRKYVLTSPGHNTVLVDGQGQHRSGKKETYFWPRPWNTPAPPQNDALWKSAKDFDYASGLYTNGYGNENEIAVVHRRQILFLKAEKLFVIYDTLTPHDQREHSYEALFHLDATNAVVDPATKSIRSDNPGAANIAIIPATGGGLDASIVKGKTDEPVQGWANHPWRAIPTAIFRKTGTGAVNLSFALEPLATNATARVASIEQIESGVRLKFADKSSITASFGPEPVIRRFSLR